VPLPLRELQHSGGASLNGEW